MSDGALQVAVAALQQIAQHGSEERDRVTARAALDCIDALGEGSPDEDLPAFGVQLRFARRVIRNWRRPPSRLTTSGHTKPIIQACGTEVCACEGRLGCPSWPRSSAVREQEA